jgi:hypothetical protein
MILLLIVLVVSLLSFASYMYCWRDIMTGNPHILSLRQMTTIMDRHVLNLIFGAHEKDYRYWLSPTGLIWFRKQWSGYYYREIAADALCAIGALYFLSKNTPQEVTTAFLLLAITCQGITIYSAVIQVKRWRHQIEEELGG